MRMRYLAALNKGHCTDVFMVIIASISRWIATVLVSEYLVENAGSMKLPVLPASDYHTRFLRDNA